MVTIIRNQKADWRIEVKKMEEGKVITRLISIKGNENLSVDEMRDQVEKAIIKHLNKGK